MTDTTEVQRFDRSGDKDPNGEHVRATDYDALAAKLADAERVARYETDIAQQALDQMKAEKTRDEAAEAALPAVYRLALGDAAGAALGLGFGGFYDPIRKKAATAVIDLPTPTAAELMARIQTGEKE